MSQTSLSSSNSTEINLNELIARRHAALISLPEELCPPSRPSSPTSEERVAALKTRIMTAVNAARGDTTNPKWGYVSRMARPGCTTRKYVGIAAGVRIGDGHTATVGKNFKWELPETEEEWAACERRFEAAVAEEEERKKARAKAAAKTATKTSRASKYFQQNVEPDPEPSSRPIAPPSKAEVIREKVERWQAQVVPVAAPPDISMSQETVDTAPSPKVAKGKARERPPQAEKVQASLGFRVVKRSSVTSAKGGSGSSSKPRVSPAARVPTPLTEEPEPSLPNQPQELPDDLPSEQPADVSEPVPVAPQIADVPELSFLPPSFPSQLQTSTPPLNDRRRKPPPIAPCSPPPSSPLSLQSFDPSRPTRSAPQQASSSLPALSPIRKPMKRGRTPNATPEDRMDISEIQSPVGRSPVSKKAKMDSRPPPPPRTEQEPASSGPVPPSTPPPTSSPDGAPFTPVSRGKGLGNAKGLPVPTTPNPHPLPTLTELLASSRRSKPRPRPPSRKNTPHSKAGSCAPDVAAERDSELPAVVEMDERGARDRTPEPSPTKTYFSSPASGSSDSPGSAIHRPRSPVSPLFTQHPSAFMPRFVSTQQQGCNDNDLFAGGQAATQASLMRGSSGFFAMGYSSQFDVEGHVEQVSELLERDVDFKGWLNDIDTDDGEEQDRDLPAATHSQDTGVVGAGYDGY